MPPFASLEVCTFATQQLPSLFFLLAIHVREGLDVCALSMIPSFETDRVHGFSLSQGTFPTLFAALQAAEYGGRKTVLNAVNDLADEALVILHEVKKDDQIDNDEDGKKDVESLSGMQLLNRKTLLVLKKMNPEKIDKAIGSIYKVYVHKRRLEVCFGQL